MQKSKFYFYKVIIGDGSVHYLELKLDEQQFNVINLSVFIDLGLIITVHKIYEDGEIKYEDGEIQDPE